MDEKVAYSNFVDLFSSDEKKEISALLERKMWILDSFFIPFSLTFQGEDEDEDDMDILFNSALPFRKLILKKTDSIRTISLKKEFNSSYRLCRIYKTLPPRASDDVFYVQADFKNLDKDMYRKLVASFFYCLPLKIMDQVFPDNDIRDVFPLAMEGNKNEAVIILKKKDLFKGMFKINCFKVLYTYSDMSEKEEKLLMKIANHLNIRTVMIHV